MVALTDTSTDETPSTLRIAVNWGDGTAQAVKTGAGSVFTHDYAGAGSYTISYKVTDAAGLSSSLGQPVRLGGGRWREGGGRRSERRRTPTHRGTTPSRT